LDSGATANDPGFALPITERGRAARVVTYQVKVIEASASAQLGLTLQHGPVHQYWATQKAHAVASVAAGVLKTYDCDISKAIGPFVRPVLRMQASTGERVLVEVWETLKVT
jgi:hypothetical protein